MSIRTRTEMMRLVAGVSAATALAGASTLHALWGSGSSWPAGDHDELADLVVGRRPMPGPGACATVAAALAVAAGTTAHATCGRPGRSTDRSRAVAGLVSVVLLVRGAGGIAADASGAMHATPAFERWNRRLYNPLCTVLAILVAVGRRSRR